ncbi:MAG TPA: DUF3800 domain-containing protein [Actinopolymorphaceae bacterium]
MSTCSPVAPQVEAVVSTEIVCDESGFDGANLVRGNTDVFSHASVRLSGDAAADTIREVRERLRSSAREYKASRLLREKRNTVVKWLLGTSGPLYGKAHVHLTDKRFFVVSRVLDLLLGEARETAHLGLHQDDDIRRLSRALYTRGEEALGADTWSALLDAALDLISTGKRRCAEASIDGFFGLIGELRGRASLPGVAAIIERLAGARPREDTFRAAVFENPKLLPSLEPFIPAIVQAVVHWTADGRVVSIVHDEQSAITRQRIAQLEEIFSHPHPTLFAVSLRGRLEGVTLVDSRAEPRVQVADFLAGAARKIASEELAGRGDPELTTLLRPYVDRFSIWPANTWATDPAR